MANAVHSAGVLLHRAGARGTEVLLVHPGGPYWRRKDAGAWQIPKGMVEPGEDDADAARREAQEELGLAIAAPLAELGWIRQAGGKRVHGFAAQADVDVAAVVSNRFEMEWPPGSGQVRSFPEVDAARWFPIGDAAAMMLPSQRPFLAMLLDMLGG
jgi:predicted NUDIX family NTP pyrophosphohydrolase